MLSHPFLKKEFEDKNFLNDLPKLNNDDEEFFNFRIGLVKKYEKVKKISSDLNLIKENEDLDDEFKRNDNEMLELIKNKDKLQKEYDDCLKNCIDDINKFKREDNEKNKLFNSKLSFLEIQIKNDLFDIKYYGYVDEKNESEESSSSSSEEEDEKK